MPPTPSKKSVPDVKLPADREDATDEWKRAYAYALSKDNSEKAAKQWADAHSEDEEYAS